MYAQYETTCILMTKGQRICGTMANTDDSVYCKHHNTENTTGKLPSSMNCKRKKCPTSYCARIVRKKKNNICSSLHLTSKPVFQDMALLPFSFAGPKIIACSMLVLIRKEMGEGNKVWHCLKFQRSGMLHQSQHIYHWAWFPIWLNNNNLQLFTMFWPKEKMYYLNLFPLPILGMSQEMMQFQPRRGRAHIIHALTPLPSI